MTSPEPSRTVVLLSGGLDSATALHVARRDGHQLLALTFDYGQRHAVEVEAARRIARAARVRRHEVLALDLGAFGGSALTDRRLEVPRDRAEAAMGGDIPITYVPARNTIFLACALGLAEAAGAASITIGVNHLDSSGYPDCRPDFLAAFEAVARLGTRAGRQGSGVRIEAPLIRLGKGEIVRLGLDLGVDFALTTSCYDPAPGPVACGACDACRLRLRGFRDAGAVDPIEYRPSTERPDVAERRGWA